VDPILQQASRRKLILIVEDDAPLRELYRRTFTQAGYAVEAVEDGVDALRRIDGGAKPAAIILDLGLPRLSGHDVHRELVARPETDRIPIVIVTAMEDPPAPRPFECVLRKPVSPDAVLHALEECIRKALASEKL
jgi:CheY-like chemotaxis protein